MLFISALAILLTLTALCYILMILFITMGILRKQKPHKTVFKLNSYYKSAQRLPLEAEILKISVVLPVRNEAAVITNILDDLAGQDYPVGFFEIIVCDDFSEDYTVEKVRKWAKDHPGTSLKLIVGRTNLRENHGKKRAIEAAIEASTGDLIITTDADTYHGRSWLKAMVSVFADPLVRMALGPVGFTGEQGIFQKIQMLEFLGLIGVTNGSANLGFPLMCNGANLAYRRQAFIDVGGFAGNTVFQSGDDQFLMMNFAKQFGRNAIVFVKDREAITLTSPCKNFGDFWEQRLRWVSKSRGYNDKAVLLAGMLTFGFPFLILIGGITGIFHPFILLLASLLWLLKILAEYPMVWLMAGFFGKKHLLNYYFVAQVFQFFYAIAVTVAGQFSGYSWKGRSFRK
ncbi:MAG: glycosyltransferase [Bacteroidota bacterium]